MRAVSETIFSRMTKRVNILAGMADGREKPTYIPLLLPDPPLVPTMNGDTTLELQRRSRCMYIDGPGL